MINEILLDMLKRKIENKEITVDEIKDEEYKSAIEAWLA